MFFRAPVSPKVFQHRVIHAGAAAGGEPFSALLQLRQRLGFACVMQQPLGLRAPPFLRRLHQPVLRFVERLQCDFDRGQRFGGQWQTHVRGVVVQAVARGVLGSLGIAALGFGLVQPGAGGLEFAGAGGDAHQRLAQRLVGWGAAPFVLGLASVGFELFELKRHGGGFFGQAIEALRDDFQSLLARHRAGDVDRLRFAPCARQRAEAKAAIGAVGHLYE